tara:strand:+ start:209 stop:445 length:237 start_codon:yes stop_codon:yes gene_type:complete
VYLKVNKMAQKKGKKAGCGAGQVYNQKLKKCVKANTSYEKKIRTRNQDNPSSENYSGPNLDSKGNFVSRKKRRMKKSL